MGGKLKGYGIFRKEIPGYRASNLYFLKYKIGSSINIKDVEVIKMVKKYLQMRLFVFFCQILALQDRLSEKNSPLPPLGLFRFDAAVLGRDLDRSGFRKRICHFGIAWIMAQEWQRTE